MRPVSGLLGWGKRMAASPASPPTAPPPPQPAVQSSEDDRYFLEGPHARFKELLILLGAARDFIRGFRVLHFVGPCVTVFGSARFKEDHPYYAMAREVGSHLSNLEFTVMTG